MRLRRVIGFVLMAAGALAMLTPLASWVAERRRQEILLARFDWHSSGGSAPTPAVQDPAGDATPAGVSTALAGDATPDTPAAVAVAPDGDAGRPTRAPSAPSGPYRIDIPAAGIRYMVQEGIDDEPLGRGPGHYPTTPLPGEPGNAAIAGHRTVKGRPSFFYKLDSLKPGDTITITYPDRTLSFAVDRVFLTSPYDISVLSPTTAPALTLTTCDPPGLADRRLIVQAKFKVK